MVVPLVSFILRRGFGRAAFEEFAALAGDDDGPL